MTARRLSRPDAATDARGVPTPPSVARRRATPGAGPDRVPVAARSRKEADERFAAAHAAWIEAMHRASTGRPADLASLAIAQAEYEAAAVDRSRWAGERVAIPVRTDESRSGIEVVVGQELAWRRVRDEGKERRGGLGRLLRRFKGRG